MAEPTVQGWMISPGHPKNILIPRRQNKGFGAVIAPDTLFDQELKRPRRISMTETA